MPFNNLRLSTGHAKDPEIGSSKHELVLILGYDGPSSLDPKSSRLRFLDRESSLGVEREESSG